MSDTTALIVGGTSGIGLATARRLLGAGETVHIAGRSADKLAAIAESDPELHGHRADGGDRARMAALAADIGTVDHLVVTLSGAEGQGPIADLDLEILRRAFDAKLWAHLTTVQAVLPHLAERGSITLVGAVSSRMGMPGTAGLAALNGAVEALVKPLAVELAPVRVNGVSPGAVDTPWWSGLPDEVRAGLFAQMEQALPARHVATADEVAETMAMAATNPSLSGTVLEVDGGARLVSLG